MSAQTKTKKKNFLHGLVQWFVTKIRHDLLQWLLVFALLGTAVIGNYQFNYISLPLRTLAVIAIMSIAGVIALFMTSKGKAVVTFAKEALIEMHKVIWPTKQETMQKTLAVVAITLVISLLLWGFDSLAIRLVSFITSFRGL